MTFEELHNFQNITTYEKTKEYEASQDIFASLLREVKELSRKKPDACMSAGKVKIVNRVLQNLLTILEGQPDAKYLEILDDDELPQVSDAVLVMVQFESALESFKRRHFKNVHPYGSQWITEDLIDQIREDFEARADEDEDDNKY
ncbi:hypothetical protein [Poseidonocella sp. HB161398]|uniref:hypothetical protein n=1 Tax=Poseidonocella sp. HB161398 TaxID=2320855 RepID=UPI001F0D4460|nr:hypothetical protein [Poseidonocella sp. HB161398]